MAPHAIQVRPVASSNAVSRLVRVLDPSVPLLVDNTGEMLPHLDLVAYERTPKFGVKEASEIFFQRTSSWWRWMDREGHLDHDDTGRRVSVMRLGDKVNGIKRYSLADIELTARILHQNGKISVTRMALALQIVHLIAVGYGVIPAD